MESSSPHKSNTNKHNQHFLTNNRPQKQKLIEAATLRPTREHSTASSSSSSFTQATPDNNVTPDSLARENIDETEPLLSSSDIVRTFDSVSVIPQDADPFLLVHMRRKQPPPRPKYVIFLLILAFIDFSIISTCMILLIHEGSWNEHGKWRWDLLEWDILSMGALRIFTVICVDSSLWLRELGWILGGLLNIYYIQVEYDLST
ncbi:5022_t:CDS:2 [Ambispora leptoticha]|uniref:5022_t:CDS:1 n=1 Tax=Ambispora leptoticha TaxID=144679 RepID=A0A9N8ZLN9_9GLOM|nr:5022_t:CDS:2 [Ambispora leptoticha]